MTKNLFIIALATALLLGCSTTARTGKTEVEDPAAAAANAAEIAARARAAETLAAIPCRCDSIGNNPPPVKFQASGAADAPATVRHPVQK